MPVTSRHPSFHVQVRSSGAEPGIWQLLFSAVYFTVVQPIFLPPLPSPPPCIHSLWLLPSERLAAAVLLMGAGWIPFCLSPLPTFLIVLRALSWHSRESPLLLPSACCGGQKWNKGVENVRETKPFQFLSQKSSPTSDPWVSKSCACCTYQKLVINYWADLSSKFLVLALDISITLVHDSHMGDFA